MTPAFAPPTPVPALRAAARATRCARRAPPPRASAAPDARAALVPDAAAEPAAGALADGNGIGGAVAPAVTSLADIDEIVQLADEFDLGDLRIEAGGVSVEITRAGGLGFVDGELREPPLAPVAAAAAAAAPLAYAEPKWGDDDGDGGESVQDAVAAAVADEEWEAGADAAAAPQSEQQQPAGPADPNVVFDSDFVVTSNRVGFFFSGARNKPPLVGVGDHVAFNQPVCIIEQLGQQYVYLSEVSGTVTKIFVEDGDAVQYDQQVMVIRPD